MNLADFATIEDARTYYAERQIPTTAVLRLLSVTGSDVTLFASTAARAKAFLLSIQAGVSEFDCRNSTVEGAQLQGLLDLLIADGAVNETFKTEVIKFCNTTSQPYKNTTQHEFDLAKGTISRIEKTASDGWLSIETNADCEAHYPQIYVDINGVKQRVAGFQKVEKADKYNAQVPTKYSTFYVDNAYGVII